MTERIKNKLDKEIRLKWEHYVYKEITKGSKRNFQHINEIIEEERFKKVYLNNSLSLWLFILCDGEYGFFDGYTWYDYIPRAVIEVMEEDILYLLERDDFKEINGCFHIKKMNTI